jgi:hypothetical protein
MENLLLTSQNRMIQFWKLDSPVSTFLSLTRVKLTPSLSFLTLSQDQPVESRSICLVQFLDSSVESLDSCVNPTPQGLVNPIHPSDLKIPSPKVPRTPFPDLLMFLVYLKFLYSTLPSSLSMNSLLQYLLESLAKSIRFMT